MRSSALFQSASVRKKLALIIAITCAAGIVVAGAALFAFQTYTLRATYKRDILALADIVANNLSGPLAFGDKKAALEVLASLKAKPQITSALVRTRSGETFVSVGAAVEDTLRNESPRLRAGLWSIHVTAPIAVERDTAGSLLLHADFRSTFFGSLRLFTLVMAAICTAALGIALTIGYSLQGLVTEPVARLATAAHEIGARRDYGVRVQKTGDDELGALTDAFNGMLEQLQRSDADLRRTNAALTSEIEQRHRLQSELVEASRLAGMAEVATGVLHNVGNVLNSVNVSAGLLREQIQISRMSTLQRTAELLRTHQANLAAYLTTDDKGKRVPVFLIHVIEQVTAEHARMREELVGLTRNIDHIKEIVAMQQTYAKASAVIEHVDLCELANQAISIHRMSLECHQVDVIRDFPASLPPLPTDRHKILQVLTNFVANAIHAVKPNLAGDRRIKVSIANDRAGEIALSVADNGEGIPAENLPKLFRQGFTTRKEGHGFGLHSGMLVVKSLGGRLEATSPGLGHGATFTLHLPVTAEPFLQPT